MAGGDWRRVQRVRPGVSPSSPHSVSHWRRSPMSNPQPNYPLHGISLKAIVEELVERRGFADLGSRIKIRCFTHDPSVQSALKFLRKTEWARRQVEALYLEDQREKTRSRE